MSLTDEPSRLDEESNLEALDSDPGDQSGRETFSKYRYQAKLTLSHWLTTLLPGGPIRIYSEHQEDIVIVYSNDQICFGQVKSRNPGLSRWTLPSILKEGGGLDSLLRCYRLTRDLGNHSTYELFLEGELTRTASGGIEFLESPASANAAVRKKMSKALDATAAEIDEFLPRLHIKPRQISRAHIDDRNMLALWKMLQTLAYPVIQNLYHELLTSVENLQSGDRGQVDWWTHVRNTITDAANGEVGHLSADRLREILPGSPIASPEEWARLLSDPTLSDLERKLILAGADHDDIREAKELRMLALPRIREIEAGPGSLAGLYEQTCDNLLRYAKGVARIHYGKPSVAKNVLGQIVSSADSQMRTYDKYGLFGEPFSLAGVVCNISDQCRFKWQ